MTEFADRLRERTLGPDADAEEAALVEDLLAVVEEAAASSPPRPEAVAEAVDVVLEPRMAEARRRLEQAEEGSS